MADRWVRRKSHIRRLRPGFTTRVRENWVRYGAERNDQNSKGHCPKCGASIIGKRMPNGGHVYFEGAKGLERVKHACMHRGEGLGKRRDDLTLDLFEDFKDAVET